MNRNWMLGVLTVGILVGAPTATLAVRKGAPLQTVAKGDRVAEMFDSMRAGKLAEIGMPELKWEDIPTLLKLGQSNRMLKTFPRNSLSSFAQFECSEGIIALWFIEGIRIGAKHFMRYPSLNPMIGPFKSGVNYEETSESHRAQALAAYERWWGRVKAMPPKQAAKIDPLAKSGVDWYGRIPEIESL